MTGYDRSPDYQNPPSGSWWPLVALCFAVVVTLGLALFGVL